MPTSSCGSDEEKDGHWLPDAMYGGCVGGMVGVLGGMALPLALLGYAYLSTDPNAGWLLIGLPGAAVIGVGGGVVLGAVIGAIRALWLRGQQHNGPATK
jgi:hypothetical protein